MRIQLTILCILLSKLLILVQDSKIYKSKDCEIINGETVNCGDYKNKNGNWLYYKVGMTSHTDFVKNPSDYSEEKTYLYLISKGEYLNNSRIGKWIFYSDYKSYEKQYIEKITYYNLQSHKDSLELEFYNDSTIKSKAYWNNGIKDSLFVYYPSGQNKYKGYFGQSKLQQFWIYYSNGNLKYQGNEINDYKIGTLISLDANGQPKIIREKDILLIAASEDLDGYLD